MAKRDTGTTRKHTTTTSTSASEAASADVMEERLVAFARKVGRIAGTLQAKAEGWMDRDRLNQQIASVRDGAADLLAQLAEGATKASTKMKAKTTRPAAAPARGPAQPRSGGVDAPGKKHRKPAPTDPGATTARSQAAKMRAAKPMAKTNRRRGRG